jgi:hypothetical protein
LAASVAASAIYPTGDPDGAPTESTASRSPGFTSSPGPAGAAVDVVEAVEADDVLPVVGLEPEASPSTASEPIGGVGGISVEPLDVPVVVAASLRVVFSSLMLVAPSVAARPRRSRASHLSRSLTRGGASVEGVDTLERGA